MQSPLPPSSCEVCVVSPDSLLKCSCCQVVLYGSREHQSKNFAAHKAICKRVKKIRDLIEKEAVKIRNAEEDDRKRFEEGFDHFWMIHSTRPYMRTKMELIRTLSAFSSRLAIKAALVEAMDCMRLCRGDNMGVREVIPTLMLLLDQYQEAYDFIKWYARSG